MTHKRHKDTTELVKYLYDDGYTTAYIADILSISIPVVDYHLRKMRKAGLIQNTYVRTSDRCMSCEYDGIRHHWCMKWEE
jgi:DNA-binding transcriptional regulator LsrR (DeoR family)